MLFFGHLSEVSPFVTSRHPRRLSRLLVPTKMQLWFALASLASVAALNAGVRVQPRTSTTKIGRVVPARCVLAEAEEFSLKQFAIDAGITTLRLGTCALMIHHGFDKVQVTLTSASTAPELLLSPTVSRRLRRMWMASAPTSSPSSLASCRALLPSGPCLLRQRRLLARHFSPSASSPAQLPQAWPQRWLLQTRMRDVGTAWPRPQNPTSYSDAYLCGIAPALLPSLV